ncbi:class I SAM-dependent methyltransferase [Daejeonella lutea]|uniref:2-polyprenyl-3-methyl-5-hydroxy-6-metoxy-1,4-benzoquinol methylase n=1 Tax=Daejeonella lutea TaxID=572036 RepID=A0A1T5FBR4_9SPHI|nr:class I SAM-dependent methyltransferase [Daejeonella lutea]SKB93609.1 2-polyprenyl-3-methyl-5-hydroxy-6-metoxy-1,4-benzoquinol methylase [Daejeonella lutea]
MDQVFNAYARYYDLLYKDKDYTAESKYIHSIIDEFSPQAAAVLELGSGTGAHAEHLARLGFSVHGIDLSPNMVERANTRKEGLSRDVSDRLSFETGDVRNYNTEVKYDVVISLFHVMSYQTSNEDLRATFETAAKHLKPGGIFIFDYWFGPAVLTQKPEVKIRRINDEKIDVLRIAEPVLNPLSNSVEVNFTVMITEKHEGAKTDVVEESHLMRYFFLPELELISTRFKVLETRAWMSDDLPTADDWAAISILKLN